MKKITVILCLISILFTGCTRSTDNLTTDYNISAVGSSSITEYNNAQNETTEVQNTYSEDNRTPESKMKMLAPPNEFDNGVANIEDIVSPWTEENVNEAWKMSWLSDSFTSYYDRCFADLDGDGVQELLLTVNSAHFFIAGYKIDNDEIQYLDTALFYGPIARARLALPPTDEETLSSSNSVHIKPTDVPYEYDMWDLTMTADKRDFKIRRDNNGNNYFVGYGYSMCNATCWVIKLDIQDSKLVWEKVYEWGYYGLAQPGFSLHYYAINNGIIDVVTKEEIDDFLAQLN